MSLTITLQPEVEARFLEEATRNGVTLEQLASQRLLETEALWRIRTSAPELETRQLHRLLRRQNKGVLTEAEQIHLQNLLDERESRGAQRMQDLALLSQLSGSPVLQLMERLGIRPLSNP